MYLNLHNYVHTHNDQLECRQCARCCPALPPVCVHKSFVTYSYACIQIHTYIYIYVYMCG